MQPPAAWPGAEPLQFRLNGEEAAGEAPQFRYFLLRSVRKSARNQSSDSFHLHVTFSHRSRI
jgi:hypothetical protein